MRNKLTKIALVAGFALALALTFFCSSDKDDDPVDDGMLSYGGQKYKIVEIGRQIWMAENLNFSIEGSKCYEGKDANCDKYGRLYNWEKAKAVCPPNWRLPSNADWDKLYRYADSSNGNSSPYESPTAGKYLKAKTDWNVGGENRDEYGFTALPGGFGLPSGGFGSIGNQGYWWSFSQDTANNAQAYSRYMQYSNENAYYSINNKDFFFSVRCIKE